MGFEMEKVVDTLVLCYQIPFHHCTIFMYHSLRSGRIWPIYDFNTKAHIPTPLILLKRKMSYSSAELKRWMVLKSGGMEHCTVYTAKRWTETLPSTFGTQSDRTSLAEATLFYTYIGLMFCVCHISAFYWLWRGHWNLPSGDFIIHNCDTGQACLPLGFCVFGHLWGRGPWTQVRFFSS